MDFGGEAIGEACGVFGMYDLDGQDVASSIYYGLYALQHRGQESAGIAVTDTAALEPRVACRKAMGLVHEVFSPEDLARLKGNLGVGHVRYSTAGGSLVENSQPLVISYIKGTLILAHNGNLINTPELRRELSRSGAIFQTTIDSESIAYHIARARTHTSSVEAAVIEAMRHLRGAYSFVLGSPRKLIGARDPLGFKPLVIGRRGRAFVLASETCALDTIGARLVRDVEPGEVVTIDASGRIASDRTHCPKRENTARCIFEYIYFARPDSVLDGVSVVQARMTAGRCLAKDHPIEADLVVGVPESGNLAALGYAMESGIPYGIAFTKNTYVGRTFISPKQSSREKSVHVKLNVLKDVVAGKRIVMIDDSIVRGTTSHQIIDMLRDAGATEVHMCVSAPPFLHPCYFGIDIPSEDQLIASGRTVEEIRRCIGADSMGYLDVRRLSEMVGGLPVCRACFDGQYPLAPPTENIRGEYAR